MNNAITNFESEPMLRLRERIDVIRQTVAKGASNAQLEMFLAIAERYQLDPFLKEIWFIAQTNTIMTSRDGYLKIAMRNADYDGIVSAAVREGDTFSMDPLTPTVKHNFGAKRGAILGAYAVVYHKTRRPVVCYADMAEYKKGGTVWGTYQSAMIQKVAEVMALKRQFAITGMTTREEVDAPSTVVQSDTTYIEVEPVVEEKPEEKPEAKPEPAATKPLHELNGIERIQAAMVDRQSIGDALQGLLSELIRKLGDEKSYLAFANILEDHGATEWQSLKTVRDAKAVAAAMYELIHKDA